MRAKRARLIRRLIAPTRDHQENYRRMKRQFNDNYTGCSKKQVTNPRITPGIFKNKRVTNETNEEE